MVEARVIPETSRKQQIGAYNDSHNEDFVPKRMRKGITEDESDTKDEKTVLKRKRIIEDESDTEDEKTVSKMKENLI